MAKSNLEKLKALVSVADEATNEKTYATRGERTLATMQKIFAVIDQGITKEEFVKSFKNVLEIVNTRMGQLSEKNQKELEKLLQTVERLGSEAEKSRESTKKEVIALCEQMVSDIRFQQEALMSEAQRKLDEVQDGNDGMDADEDAVVEKVLAKIPPPPTPKDPELTLEDKEEIENKIEELGKKVSNIRTAPFIGPSRGIFVYANGSKNGLQNTLNFVGSGVTYSIIDGMPTLTITGGSGATAIEDKSSGAVDGSNLVFTFAHQPLYVLVDGVAKYVTTDYTLSGGNLTVTLLEGAPTRTIRSVYSA